MTAFEARQLTGIEPANATEESIFAMLDTAIAKAATTGFTGIMIWADDWLADLVDKYMAANGFKRHPDSFFREAWFWGDIPAVDYPQDRVPVLETSDGWLRFPDRSGVSDHRFVVDYDGERKLLPESEV